MIGQPASAGQPAAPDSGRAGAHHVAHDAFVHRRGIEAGAPHGLRHHQRAEIGRREVLQRTEEFPGWRAHRADDHRFAHRSHKGTTITKATKKIGRGSKKARCAAEVPRSLVVLSDPDLGHGVLAKQRLQPRQDDRRRPGDLASPVLVGHLDEERVSAHGVTRSRPTPAAFAILPASGASRSTGAQRSGAMRQRSLVARSYPRPATGR